MRLVMGCRRFEKYYVCGIGAIWVALALGGCAETRYAPFSSEPVESAGTASPVRVVEYEMHPDFLAAPMNCLIVLPISGANLSPELAAIVEDAIAPQLSIRVGRIIGGARRDRLAQYHGIALGNIEGARSLATLSRCNGIAGVRVVDAEASYAVVAANIQIGMEIDIIRAGDGQKMWRARHTANRIEGGIPFGFGAVTAVYSATNLAADSDAVHALVGDVVRRVFVTWPMTRYNADTLPGALRTDKSD